METLSHLDNSTLEGVLDLIEINNDSARGFDRAADAIDDPVIADWLRRCGLERRAFSEELKRYARMNGEQPDESGTPRGALHRWWLTLRGAVSPGADHAVLAEAERGEHAIKQCYERVIRETAGSPLNAALLAQHASVKTVHDRVRDLRDAHKE